MTLKRETPFSRLYQADDPKFGGCNVSRYWDGSASMTAAELQRDWPTLTDEELWYFCDACCWLYTQSDFADIRRFLMLHASIYQWHNIFGLVATYLTSESEDFRGTYASAIVTRVANPSPCITHG